MDALWILASADPKAGLGADSSRSSQTRTNPRHQLVEVIAPRCLLSSPIAGDAADELVRDRFLLGSPDEVAEQMLAFHRAAGINHLIMSVQWPGMPQHMVLDVLHMLAEEVFPKVRQG